MALIFSSSDMALSIAADILEAAAVVVCFTVLVAGGLPETYLAARPLPGTAAGSRLASTVESFGIISVSSVYSTMR